MVLAATLLAVLGVAVIGFYSGAETGLYTVNRFRLRQRAHRGERSARVLARLLADPTGLIVTLLLGHNLAVYLVTAVVTRTYQQSGIGSGGSWWRSPDALATFTLVVPLFVFAEVLPKNYFRKHTERLSYLAGWGLAATKGLLWPLIWALSLPAALVPRGHGPGAGLGLPQLTRRMLDHLLSHGRETGELTAEQERLARNVLRAGERRVMQLASPVAGPGATAGTLTVPADEKAGRVLQRLIAARARLALVSSASADRGARSGERGAPSSEFRAPSSVICREVLGYVRLFDLLAPGAQGRPVSELARPVPRLAAHATLRKALATMQRECADVAIVESPSAGRAASAGAGGALPEPGTGHGEPGCPVLGVVLLPQLIAELLSKPLDTARGREPVERPPEGAPAAGRP